MLRFSTNFLKLNGINPLQLKTTKYIAQKSEWPTEGNHILAQYDESSIVVYQAYRPAIGNFAAKNGYFGGEFSFSRMSWIKPNFLWMMFRSGWGEKPGQEVILAIRLKRDFFDSLLASAVFSAYSKERHSSQEQWKKSVAQSEVRLQWDPDHTPSGGKTNRRAVQIGLRNATLKEYAKAAIINIFDISDLVRAQKENVQDDYSLLQVPEEKIYIPSEAICKNIGLSC